MLVKFKLQNMEGKSALVGIAPDHVVTIQVGQNGCLITTVRGTYHVVDDYDTACRKLFGEK